jgi:hypothetical protein
MTPTSTVKTMRISAAVYMGGEGIGLPAQEVMTDDGVAEESASGA